MQKIIGMQDIAIYVICLECIIARGILNNAYTYIPEKANLIVYVGYIREVLNSNRLRGKQSSTENLQRLVFSPLRNNLSL
jgi:hypothetical protein